MIKNHQFATAPVNYKLFLFFWQYEYVLKMALKICLFFGRLNYTSPLKNLSLFSSL